MRKLIIFFIINIFIYYENIIFANNIITNRIREEVIKNATNANLGIKVRNLKTSEIVYEQNAESYFTFASSLKFMTIIALREYFGDEYKFSSKILRKNNDFYLDINDPLFSTSDLRELIKSLKLQGFSNIKGNIYIVNSQFKISPNGEGKMIEDLSYCYGSPITKVGINKNCIKIKAKAEGKINSPVKLEIQDLNPYKIINLAIKSSNKINDKIYSEIQDNILTVKGTLNKNSGEIIIGTVVHNNIKNIELILEKILKKEKLILEGKILTCGLLPKDSIKINSKDRTFKELGSIALKESDNYITDYLFAHYVSKFSPKDWENSADLLKQFIFEKFSVNLSKGKIFDGSGLSRKNFLTVNNFDEFLTAIYNKFDIGKILPLMCVPGEKGGTLETRLKDVPAFTKTGGLLGVTSIIGYIFDSQQIPYSFVIVRNNELDRQKSLRFEDKIITIIAGKDIKDN